MSKRKGRDEKQAEKARSEIEGLNEMLEEARQAYKILYDVCKEMLVDPWDKDNEPLVLWLDFFSESVRVALNAAELASPFGAKGEPDAAKYYCRVCGQLIENGKHNQTYCSTCSRSTQQRTHSA